MVFQSQTKEKNSNVNLIALGLTFVMLVAFIVFYLFFTELTSKYKVSPMIITTFLCCMASVPLLWMYLWKKDSLCFIITAAIVLFGDTAPALTSPAVALITLPNFLRILYANRNSTIKFFLAPFFVIGATYFIGSFLINFIDKPIMISYGMVFMIGPLSSLIGAMIIYHLIYIPLSIYHLSKTNPNFLKNTIYYLSYFINLIVVVGVIQFFLHFSEMMGEGVFRVSSIMRIATRLGPFVVISIPLLMVGLQEEQKPKWRLYWWMSIIFSIFILLVTYTRGAIVAGVVLWICYLVSLVTSKQYKILGYLLFSSALLGGWFFFLAGVLDLDFFTRFDSHKIDSGMGKRYAMWNAYFDGIQLQATSGVRQFLHTLFGYGIFSERFFVYPLNRDAHNTFISTFNTFGGIGLILYYIPYFWFMGMSLIRIFTANPVHLRPRYSMTFALMFLFIISGVVHNKLYSPIESAYTWLLVGVLLKDDLVNIFPMVNHVKASSLRPQGQEANIKKRP